MLIKTFDKIPEEKESNILLQQIIIYPAWMKARKHKN